MCYGGCQCKRCMGPDEERTPMTNHMTWTTTRPTQPGWYWCRWVSDEDNVGAFVCNLEFNEDQVLCIVQKEFHWLQLDDFSEREWSGPLPEPDEPTERDERETQP